MKDVLLVYVYAYKKHSHFVFCPSSELELIYEDNDNNGASYQGAKVLGCEWFFF